MSIKYLLVLLPYLCNAQPTAYHALIGFKNIKTEPFNNEFTVCPWQSFRFVGYYSYQIDIVCDSVELSVLQQDDHLFADALNHIRTAYPTSIYNSELFRRWDRSPRRYKIHIPTIGGPATLTQPNGAIDITKNGTGGWYYMAHRSGIGIAVKKLKENLFQVSAAMFLKATE